MKRQAKAEPGLEFNKLMQAAIDWLEEEEPSLTHTPRGPVRGNVQAAAVGDPSPMLAIQVLQESVKQLAARQEELFRALQESERGSPAPDPRAGRYSGPTGGQIRAPLRDENGQLICYPSRQPGHTSRNCPRGKGEQRQANAITSDAP